MRHDTCVGRTCGVPRPSFDALTCPDVLVPHRRAVRAAAVTTVRMEDVRFVVIDRRVEVGDVHAAQVPEMVVVQLIRGRAAVGAGVVVERRICGVVGHRIVGVVRFISIAIFD